MDAVEEKGPANFITYGKVCSFIPSSSALSSPPQIVWLSSIFYNACLGFIKVSVLCLYMRLGDLVLRRLSIFLAGVIVCQALANVLTCIFQCNPVPGAWDVSLDPKCIDINAFYLTNAALNIATDLATYALPIRMVLNLQTPTKQKLAVAVMFGLGFLYVSPPFQLTPRGPATPRPFPHVEEAPTNPSQRVYLLHRPHILRS